ncbi:MAG: SMC family ATPase [Candidatus Babeliales bacterium]
MIPLKLHIKNFLSYGPQLQTIDFGSHQLICLSGKNGHGKSALLDAITWALWGQARKITGSSKPDAQLVHLGQTHMVVILDFMFNNNRYRIKREFGTPHVNNNPISQLEFGVWDEHAQKLHPLTDKTMRATQQKIDTLLGISFDTFVNSAFLRQGQANEFSKKTPKERKEILASILQLGHYEQLRKKTSDHVRAFELELYHLEHRKTELTHACAHHDARREQKDALYTQKKQIEQQEQHAAHHYKQLQAEQESALRITLQWQTAVKEREKCAQDKQHKEEELRALFAYWRSINKQLRHAPTIAQLEEQKKHIITAMQQQQQKQARLLQLSHEQNALEKRKQEIEQQTQAHFLHHIKQQELVVTRVDNELIYAQKKNNELLLHKQAVEQQLIQQQTQSMALAAIIATAKPFAQQLAVEEEHFEKRKRYYHTWVARLTAWQEEKNNIIHKENIGFEEHDSSCPLCEQNLSAARKRFLQNKFIKMGSILSHRIERLKKNINSLKELLVKQHTHIQQQRKEHEAHLQREMQLQQLLKNRDLLVTQQHQIQQECEEAFAKIAALTAELTIEKVLLDTALSEKQSALHAHEEYQTTIKKIATIAHAITQESALQQETDALVRLETITQQERMLNDLLLEGVRQTERAHMIHSLCCALKTIKEQLTQCDATVQKLKIEQERYADMPLKQQRCTDTIQTVVQQKEQIITAIASVEQEINALEKQKQELRQTQELIEEKKQISAQYSALAQAFGKDGIQALLIEDVLPEIEQEANDLLARLTNNQAHITIESLRDLKKGGTKETLDINISDAFGVRPYELFSGGEAFRIDFALRIAIAKLLARRAGASLQTLIVDEGFGSQDEEGLALLMDGIHKIQDDFAKIIIVSHLPIMKEQFPVHFMINKSPTGTIVQTIHQG